MRASGGCRGFVGPCPSAPLDEWNAHDCTDSAGRFSWRHDVGVTTRIVYTDLDGTMVGPRGSFWHTAGRELTDSPATAIHTTPLGETQTSRKS